MTRPRAIRHTRARRRACRLALLIGVAGGCTGEDRTERDELDLVFATADSLRDAGANAESAELYLTLRDSLRAAGNAEGEWYAQLWWANALARLGPLDSAGAALDRALDLAGDRPDRLGWTRYIRSWTRWLTGDFDEALAEAEAARAVLAADPDPDLAVDLHHMFGRIYSHLGRHRDALREHEDALRALEEIDAPSGQIAFALTETAIDYRHLGRYEDARAALRRSAAIHRENGDSLNLGFSLGNLANIFGDLGEHRTALDTVLRAMELVRHTASGRILANGHRNVAEFYRLVGNPDAARAHLDSALMWAERASAVYGRVGSLSTLGQLELQEGALEAAERAIAPAIALADSAGLGTERANLRAYLARLRTRQGRDAEAVAAARRAVALADALGDPAVQIRALESLGEALERSGAVEQALREYGRTIDLLESWRGRLAVGDLRAGIIEPRTLAYDGTIRLLLAGGDAGGALEVAERAKARRLLELMAQGRQDPASESGRIRERLRSSYEALAGAEGAVHDSIVLVIEDLVSDLERVEAAARRADPVGAAARHPAPRPPAELRSGLVDEGTSLLVFHWGEENVFGWLARDDRLRGAHLGHPDTLAALVEFARDALFEPATGPDWRPVARRAYRLLLEPLGPIDAGTLLLVPDGPLATLPFEALIDPETDEPLGAGPAFVYGPSASVLLTLRATPPGEEWERSLLAVGDPSVAGPVRARAVRAGGLDELGPLPFAAREARELAELFAGDGADLLIGEDATLGNWRELEPDRYRYLHFAAHAVVSDERPARTHIVLADGGLDLAAIRGLSLRAELVTLSACETGLGRHVSGEGLIGLPHAFLAAGARGAVVSLWKVPDRAAYEYMRELYDRLATGRPAAEAMRDVRRERIRAGGGLSHPSAWAGFVLVGHP